MFKTVERKNTHSIKWDQAKGDEIPFTVADSGYAAPQPVIDALNKRVSHGVFGYTYPDDDYYLVIQNFVKRHYNYQVEKNQIALTTGVVGSLFYALKLLENYSDGVIIQTPVYHMFYQLIEKANKQVIENKLIEKDGYYSIDFENLEQLFKEGHKIMILCSPHNPVGRVFKAEELKKLVLLAKEYDVYLLSDEVHGDLILNDNKFISLMHYYEYYGKMMVFIAPSKTFNLAGLNISLVLSKNDQLIEDYKNLTKKYHFNNPSLLSLTALHAAYTDCDQWMEEQNKHLSRNFKIIEDYFKNNHLAAIITPLEGTYLAWLNLKYLQVSQPTLLETFKKEGILVGDGTVYAQDCLGYIRLNFACSEEVLLEGLHRLSKAIATLENQA